MDYYTHNYEFNTKKRSMNQSRKFFYFKKAIKIILSLSIFSFLFSHSSSLVPLLVQSFDHYFSDFSIKIFTFKTERNYVFLLCNGILVLIIQTSGLINKITPVKKGTTPKARGTTPDQETAEKVEKTGEFQEKKIKGVEKAEFLDQEQGLRLINRDDEDDDGAAEAEIPDFEKLDENLEKIEEVSIFINEENEEEFDDDGEMISADELNKKFEDFIKKVKQEIQVEFNAADKLIS